MATRPDIFLKAASKLTRARECAVFEDSEAGVRAAHAAASLLSVFRT